MVPLEIEFERTLREQKRNRRLEQENKETARNDKIVTLDNEHPPTSLVVEDVNIISNQRQN